MGKVIGGGLPVGAYGGKKDIMKKVAPEGPVYQAGTLSGNPVAMAAGIATLRQLNRTGFYEDLDKKSERLAVGLEAAATAAGQKVTLSRVGSMMGLFFTGNKVDNFEDAKTSNLDMFTSYYTGMLDKGIYLAPSQFEALFVSAAHTNEQIDRTILAAEQVLGELG